MFVAGDKEGSGEWENDEPGSMPAERGSAKSACLLAPYNLHINYLRPPGCALINAALFTA